LSADNTERGAVLDGFLDIAAIYCSKKLNLAIKIPLPIARGD